MSEPPEEEGQVYTLGLLEQVRAESNYLGQAVHEFYFRVEKLMRELGNPNLHDIGHLPFRVELWDRYALHIRWTVAACGNVLIAHGAFDQAIKSWPDQRFTLRNGIMVIREHSPSKLGKER
jgi:hypothetical protein